MQQSPSNMSLRPPSLWQYADDYKTLGSTQHFYVIRFQRLTLRSLVEPSLALPILANRVRVWLNGFVPVTILE